MYLEIDVITTEQNMSSRPSQESIKKLFGYFWKWFEPKTFLRIFRLKRVNNTPGLNPFLDFFHVYIEYKIVIFF